MSLTKQLAAARQRRAIRQREKRESQRRQAIASGKPVRESKAEVVEKVTSAMFARDFLNDLDRLLIARGATLCLSWRGKKGQLYLLTGDEEAPTVEVLMEARRNSSTVLGCFEGEIGQRILALMRQHEISMCIGWVSGALLLQAGNQSVSTTYCLTMIRAPKEGSHSRYMNETEQEARHG